MLCVHVCVCVCVCMCVTFIKRAQLFGGEMFRTACSPLKWESGHITHSLPQAPPFNPPPPPLYLLPPVVSCSLYLISLSQAFRSECCLLCSAQRPICIQLFGCRLWVSPHSFQAPNAI